MDHKAPQLVLGLDVGSQSLSGVVIDLDSAEKVGSISLDYRNDSRLAGRGLRGDYLVPPRVPGEADQPPELYLAALDALLGDLRDSGLPMGQVVAINWSGQQHGHVYLNREAAGKIAGLRNADAVGKPLVEHLAGGYAYGTAPIWMTANTTRQAAHVREQVGGREAMVRLSGSDAPLRFTGAVVRRVGEQFPEAYRDTATIHLISSFIPAVLSGRSAVPIDTGNACGMSLMDYFAKAWSPELLRATAHRLPGGQRALKSKLPKLAAPDTIVGKIAAYFVEKFGFSSTTQIVAGSGDNPQAKVLVDGDLLSLGTSFVFMVATDGQTVDLDGMANAMYDGLGRPFMFGCRTNGALVWDAVRAQYGYQKDEYGPGEAALQATPPGSCLVFDQPKPESFPPSGIVPRTHIAPAASSFASDYAGVIESSLAAVYVHSRGFMRPSTQPLFVTGGASSSPEILRRVAAIWNRPVVAVDKAGPALGAALAGASAWCQSQQVPLDLGRLRDSFLKGGEPIAPGRMT